MSSASVWPYFYTPKFETFANEYMILSRAEYVGVNNVVYDDQRDSYVDWSSQHYEDFIREGHAIKYGHYDNLNNDTSKFNHYVSRKKDGQFVPDINRSLYFVRSTTSPPPRTYGAITNINIGALANNQDIMEEVLARRIKVCTQILAKDGAEALIEQMKSVLQPAPLPPSVTVLRS